MKISVCLLACAAVDTPRAAESAGRSRWVQGMAWAGHRPSSSARARLSSKVSRLAYLILNRFLKALSLMEHPIVLHN